MPPGRDKRHCPDWFHYTGPLVILHAHEQAISAMPALLIRYDGAELFCDQIHQAARLFRFRDITPIACTGRAEGIGHSLRPCRVTTAQDYPGAVGEAGFGTRLADAACAAGNESNLIF